VPDAARPATAAPGQTISPDAPPPPKSLPAVVLDPGHGGDDRGARSAGGIEEKQLTLDIARRMRTLLQARGAHTVLTRDSDATMALDTRAAFANVNAGILFLSIHANAAPASTVEGAEVYYLLADRVAAVRSDRVGGPAAVPVFGGGTRMLELVPWDRAQLVHLNASAAFAELIAHQMAGRIPIGASPVRRAPMRLLQSLNMPAALVEVAFLSSPVQEKQVGTDEFKNQMAQSLADAITQFQRPPDPRAR
jgi:N-acetylmuramoyl-L-alanine amidase